MALTLSNLRSKVLQKLQKETSYQGYFTDSKLDAAINDAIDYVSTFMFFSGQGWLEEVVDVNTVAGTASYAFPTDVVVVDRILYKVGDIYLPVTYDEGREDVFVGTGAGQTSSSFKVQFLGNTILFDPPPETGGTAFLKLFVRKYPDELSAGADELDAQFTRGLSNYIAYRAAAMLAADVGLTPAFFEKYEEQWKERMQMLISSRNRTQNYVQEF